MAYEMTVHGPQQRVPDSYKEWHSLCALSGKDAYSDGKRGTLEYLDLIQASRQHYFTSTLGDDFLAPLKEKSTRLD